jgi:lipopolysaccharide transport system permease protein
MKKRNFLYLLNPLNVVSDCIREADLIWQLTLRSIRAEVKGSVLGLLWNVLNPLLMLAVYVVVFGMIFGARFDESPHPGTVDYVLGLFLGLALYRLIADVLVMAPRLILNQPNYVNKVVFPLEVLPISLVYVGVYRFLITLVLFFVGTLLFGDGISWHVLLFPISAFPVVLIALGVAYFISALGVFIRDLAQITSVLSIVLLYASGVFYAATKVQALAPYVWLWLKWNPMLLAIDASRKVLLWGMSPSPTEMLYTWCVGIVVCSLGYATFTKLRPAFADVL